MSEDFFGDLGKSISRATQNAVGRTSNFIESTKITAQITTEQKEIEKLYQEIGAYVVRKVEADEDPSLSEDMYSLIEKIHDHLGRILGLKEELAGVKGMKICTSCQELIDAQVAFCPRCGAPVPVNEDLIEYADEEDVPAVYEELAEIPEDREPSDIDGDNNEVLDADFTTVEEIEALAEEDVLDAGFTTLDDIESEASAADSES